MTNDDLFPATHNVGQSDLVSNMHTFMQNFVGQLSDCQRDLKKCLQQLATQWSLIQQYDEAGFVCLLLF